MGSTRRSSSSRASGVPFRIDPIIEPIGFGFAASLGRYLEVRRRYPEAAMMMGVGNLTELTDVDSAGVNTILIGFCEELAIRSVLTTAVINWARSSVREIDLARRLAHHAVASRTLPKHVEPRLVMLRDPEVVEFGAENLDELQRRIRDPNWRIFAEGGMIHALNNQHLLRDTDPFRLFEQMGVEDAVARVLPGLRDDEGENRLDSEQDLSAGSSIGLGFPDGAREQPHREAAGRTAGRSGRPGEAPRPGRRQSGRSEVRRGAGVILEGHRDDAGPDDDAEHRAHGPGGRRGLGHGPLRPPPVPDLDDLRQSEGARRGRVSRHRRRAAAGPGRDRRAARALPRAVRPTSVVAGAILADACRFYEFRVVELDDRDDRTRIVVETVAQGRHRDFFGFNRAKHAVLEAAILATRTGVAAAARSAARIPQARGAGPEDGRPGRARPRSRCCMSTCARPPSRRALTPT